ncbi:hypothetical protein C8Q70DRAFT_921713 [Cubamyces menziesii]|nr:hypothetical protein C8Q70DRAFT_921713 [Cubamyces menziesii]
MSLSTCSFSRSTTWSSTSGMASMSTPTKAKSTSYPANTLADVHYQSEAVKNGWEAELCGRILEYPGTVSQFIDTFMPCSTPFTPTANLNNAFAQHNPQPGQEIKSYPALLAGLRRVVSSFPSDKRLTFADSHHTLIPFPFDAFKAHHHRTKPDIAVSFPGQRITPICWQNIATVLEVKSAEDEDPFPRNGSGHHRDVEQLAKNARCLLLAHGLLSAYVVGVYGRSIRIIRFDHTCAIVSQPISLQLNGARVLGKFYWHFTHPLIGSSIAGADPTVLPLDLASQNWVKEQLEKANAKDWKNHIGELSKGRRVEVYDEKTGQCRNYLLYSLVDVNGRLFSRATTVWRAIEDTRIWKDGHLVPDPTSTSPAKPQIVKDAWRQIIRTAETKFYHRLAENIPEEKRRGLPKMICGGDIGEFEVQWWNATRSRKELSSPPSSPLSSIPSDDPPPGTSESESVPTPRKFEAFCSLGNAHLPSGRQHDRCSSLDFPLPYPQHQTFSWRIIDPEYEYLERSHMRIVIDDVGRCLTDFTSTREVVQAMRDAILGHELAWKDACVLQRDVSLGNILIVDEPRSDGPPFFGFLHDFDYSSMGPVETDSEDEKTAYDSDEDVHRKERTGTLYYMAVELLEKQDVIHNTGHDLESFYWVLLWVVLRHTHCALNGQEGEALCANVFVAGNAYRSAWGKTSWVQMSLRTPLVVQGNDPLTKLIADFNRLLFQSDGALMGALFGPQGPSAASLTYQSVLALFDAALAPEMKWPSNDWKRCSLLDSERRTGTSIVEERLTVGTTNALMAIPPRAASATNRGRASKSRKKHTTNPRMNNPVRSEPVQPIPRLGSKRNYDARGDEPQPPPDTRPGKRRRTNASMGPPQILPPGRSEPVASTSAAGAAAPRGPRRRGSDAAQPIRESPRLAARRASTSDSIF